ncbi:NEDD8-activating enzyme E1 regulatory subunit, partial [Coemansia asiatica]
VESHAEIKQDLRLASPFPALLAYADAIDLGALDPTDLGHVPFVAIVIKALQRWAADNGLALGTDTVDIPFRRLDEVRAIIREMAPSADEENFVEAVKMVSANTSVYEIPSEVSLIIKDRAAAETDATPSDTARCANNASDKNKASDDADVQNPLSIPDNVGDRFWLMAKALRRFTESAYSKGALPLSGAIPDMKADTKSYIALQRVYKQKADQDKAELIKHVHQVLESAGLPQTYISQPEIDSFCKNAHRLRLLRLTPVHKELKSGPASTEDLRYSEALFHYVIFRSAGVFFSKHLRYPGVAEKNRESVVDLDKLVESDAAELAGIGNGLLHSWGMSDLAVPESLAAELARSGCDELHNIASLSGGMIAQEAIKLITHQYVPANNLCIIDGTSAKIYTTSV